MRSYSIEGNFSPISMLRAKAGMLRREGVMGENHYLSYDKYPLGDLLFLL